MDIKQLHPRIRDDGIVCTRFPGLDVTPRHSVRQPFPIFVLDLTTPDASQFDQLVPLVSVANVNHQPSRFFETEQQ